MEPLVSLSELGTKLGLPWSIRQLHRMIDNGVFKPIRVGKKCRLYFRPEGIAEALKKMEEEGAK